MDIIRGGVYTYVNKRKVLETMKIKLLADVKLYGQHRKSDEEFDVTEEDGMRLCEQGIALDMAGNVPTGKLNNVRLNIESARVGTKARI